MAAERPSRGISISDWPASPFEGATAGRRSPRASSAASLLITRLKSGEMPPGEKKVPAEEITKIAAWIDGGPGDRTGGTRVAPAGDRHHSRRACLLVLSAAGSARATNDRASRTSADADRRVCARPVARTGTRLRRRRGPADALVRAALDLTGLPPRRRSSMRSWRIRPTPRTSKLVDPLLASPHYGERWGRHWLDVAGYADSDGYGDARTPRGLCLQVSRLRDPRAQRRQAVRSVYPRAIGRRRARRSRPGRT